MASRLATSVTSPSLRLVTFAFVGSKNERRVGVHLDAEKQVLDLTAALGIKDMKSLLESEVNRMNFPFPKVTEAIKSGKSRVSVDEVKFKAPIYDPEKIICVGLNYRDHAIESKMAIPSEPVLFSKFASSIIGPNDSIIKPSESNELDYEVELVVVIGKEGKDIEEKDALNHVVGYTVGNDVSARDWQLRKPGGQWMAGKTFDTFAPIGPAIVTQVSDPHQLSIKTVLNNQQELQSSNTNQLIFPIGKLISYISKIVTLKPGDLIFTGTPPGVGFARNPPLFLKKGDKVTCEIGELGSITNDVQ